MSSEGTLSTWQQTVLVVLRFAIGWHLFYQGFGKLIDPSWSSVGYLNLSWGPFRMMAENPILLAIADYSTIWGLMIVGFFLMIGLFTRLSCLAGIALLTLIFVAIPPIDYTGFVISTTEGSELYVNKTLIEILALMVLGSFNTGHILGLDILVRHWRTTR